MPALYIGHGAPPLLDDPVWSGSSRALGRATCPARRRSSSSRRTGSPRRCRLSAPAAGTPLVYDFGGFAPKLLPDDLRDPGRRRARRPGRRDDARPRAGAPAPQPRPRPRRLGAAEGHVPGRPTSPCCSCRCPPTTPAGCSTSAGGCGRCATRACSIIGSGFLTHGLPFLTEFRIDAAAPGWSPTSTSGRPRRSPAATSTAGGVPRPAPGMPYAHPTVEHYTPLFVTLGAADRPEHARGAAHRRLLDGPVEALAAGRLRPQRMRSLRIALSEMSGLLDVLLVDDVGRRA